MNEHGRRLLWIGGPGADLFFYCFGWIPIFAAFLLADRLDADPRSRGFLLVFVLVFTFLHRHLTFPLVYGDPEQFRLRRRSYLALPVLFLAITLVSFFYVKPATLVSEPIPAEIRIAPGARQGFVFLREGAPERVRVRFRGDETTPQAVAATLNEQLSGRMTVETQDGRLRFQLTKRGPDAAFRVAQPEAFSNLHRVLGLEKATGRRFQPTRPLFIFLAALAIVWVIYHSLMQKVGLLRVYSRKAGASSSTNDKVLVLAWFGALALHLASSSSVREQAVASWQMGQTLDAWLKAAAPVLPELATLILIVAVASTVLHFKSELAGATRLSWPKLLYLVSILMLFGTFYYDLFVGYTVFAFSHAIEYIAFVNVHSGRKYRARPAESSLLARAARHQKPVMAVYCAVLGPLCLGWYAVSPASLEWYFLGSGFLHFIYDGWIWKMRRPEVGEPLNLAYSEPAPG